MTMENEVFQEDESVQAVFTDISKSQISMSKERVEWATMINEQLIPILSELLVQIKKKAADTDREWVGLDYSLGQDLDLWIKHTSAVRKALVGQQWKEGPNQEGSRDPWLANLGLRKHIASCAKKLPEYRTRLLAQQESFSSFEKVITQNIRVALSTFFDYRATFFTAQLELAAGIRKDIEKINSDADWDLFTARHPERFLTVDAPLVQPSDLKYDGYDDPAIGTAKEGPLLRKEGVIVRSYKPVYGILTKSGYLHLTPPLTGDFPDVPEVSLDLTECQLQPLMMNEKEPEEISILERQGGMFGGEKKHKIRGKTMADSAEWWGAINEQIRKQGKRPPPKPLDEVEAAPPPPIPNRPAKSSAPEPVPEVLVPEPVTEATHASDYQHYQPEYLQEPSYYPQYPVETLSFPATATASAYSSMQPIEPMEPAFSKLPLADQMDLALKLKTSTPKEPKNPWDTFNDDSGGW